MTLAAAWNTATHKYPFVPVFNISTGMINPITTKEMLSKLIPQFTRKYPLGRKSTIHVFKLHNFKYILDGTVWYPSTTLHKSRKIDRVHFTLTHYLPAYIYDFFNKIRGGDGRFVKIIIITFFISYNPQNG